MYRAILAISFVALVGNTVTAEDWTGKLIMLRHTKVQLGRPTETGLLLDGEKLNIMAVYKVRSDTGTYLELAGKLGMIHRQDAVAIDDAAAYYTQKIKSEPQESGWQGLRAIAFQYKGLQSNHRSSLTQRPGEYVLALADFNEVIRRVPGKAVWWNRRGHLQAQNSKLGEAVSDFTDAIRLSPMTAGFYDDRASIYIKLKEFDKALIDMDRAIELAPRNASAFNTRGNVRLLQKMYDQAAADYTLSTSFDSHYVVAYCNRGMVRCHQKKWDLALSDFDYALQIDSTYLDALFYRGKANKELKQFESAISDFSKALGIDGKLVDALHERSHAWYSLKNYGKSLGDMEQAVTQQPKDNRMMNCLAWMLCVCPEEKYRNGNRAVALAQQVVSQAGDQAPWHYYGTLAASQAETGQFAMAIIHQKKVIDLLLKEVQANDEDLLQAKKRLHWYEEGKAWRE